MSEPAGTTAGLPLADVVEEARRLLAAARERDVPLRLIGGLAVRLTADAHPALARSYKDIDLVTVKGGARRVEAFMDELGYVAHREFNGLNAHKRLLFYDVPHERQVDVFVGAFEMCHVIPMGPRVLLGPLSIPPAELLLTKLQVIELNEKDLRDAVSLLLATPVGGGDDGEINADRVAGLCAADWGLWRTLRQNLERVRTGLDAYELSAAERALVSERIDALWARVEAEPKPARWRLRDRVGDRRRWYEEPEEVG